MSTKLTDLAELVVSPATGDFLTVVDVSDTSGGAAGTSKKVTYDNLVTVKSTKVTLTNPQVQALHTTPIVLKAAETGKTIIPVSAIMVATYGAAAEASLSNLYIGWDEASAGTTTYWAYARQWMNGVASGQRTFFAGGQPNAGTQNNFDFSLVNKDFEVWANTAFTGGWTMTIYFSYLTQKS